MITQIIKILWGGGEGGIIYKPKLDLQLKGTLHKGNQSERRMNAEKTKRFTIATKTISR